MSTTKTAQPAKPKKLGLVFDFNAFANLKEQHGIDVLDKKSLDNLSLDLSNARKLVWAGLLHKEPNITIDEAGKRIGSMVGFALATGEIMEAIAKAFKE